MHRFSKGNHTTINNALKLQDLTILINSELLICHLKCNASTALNHCNSNQHFSVPYSYQWLLSFSTPLDSLSQTGKFKLTLISVFFVTQRIRLGCKILCIPFKQQILSISSHLLHIFPKNSPNGTVPWKPELIIGATLQTGHW